MDASMAPCKEASPVDQALMRLASEIEELGLALNGHTARLSSVISPAEIPSPPSTGPDYPGGSDVVQTICRSSDLLSALTDRVRRLTGSLEV